MPDALTGSFTNDTVEALNTFPSDWPNFELIAVPAFSGNVPFYPQVAPNDGYNYAALFMALVSPLSRGNVTIASADANHLPVVNPNWLSDPADQQVAIAAFRRA